MCDVVQLREVPRWGCSVHAKNHGYTSGAHESLICDQPRLDAFREAIERAAPGRRVLDVGTGPFMVLGRISQRSGSPFVACVEHSHRSVTLALEVLKREVNIGLLAGVAPKPPWVVDASIDEECLQFLGQLGQLNVRLKPSHLACPTQAQGLGCVALVTGSGGGASTLALYEGLSSATALPGDMELVVHEILGHIASAEGVVKAIRELRTRPGLLAPSCCFVPCAAMTMIAPTSPLPPQAGVAPPVTSCMYHVGQFPAGSVLATPQPMESYVFDDADLFRGLDDRQQRTCSFLVPDGGSGFDGLLMHLRVQLDASTTLDAYEQATTWECSYVRLLAAPIHLAGGARIEFRCHVEAGTDSPAYRVDVFVQQQQQPMQHHAEAPLAHVVTFSWSGDG